MITPTNLDITSFLLGNQSPMGSAPSGQLSGPQGFGPASGSPAFLGPPTQVGGGVTPPAPFQAPPPSPPPPQPSPGGMGKGGPDGSGLNAFGPGGSMFNPQFLSEMQNSPVAQALQQFGGGMGKGGMGKGSGMPQEMFAPGMLGGSPSNNWNNWGLGSGGMGKGSNSAPPPPALGPAISPNNPFGNSGPGSLAPNPIF